METQKRNLTNYEKNLIVDFVYSNLNCASAEFQDLGIINILGNEVPARYVWANGNHYLVSLWKEGPRIEKVFNSD